MRSLRPLLAGGLIVLAAGCSGPVSESVVIPDRLAPTVPTGLAATVAGATQVDLRWNAAIDNVGVALYSVFRNTQPAVTATSTSLSDTGLTPATTYAYTVSACDAAGNCSSRALPVQAKTHALLDTEAPSVPTGLTAAPTSGACTTSISLSWSASTDNIGVTGYRIVRGGSLLTTVTATTASNTGLSQGQTYSYTVAATDAAGNVSAPSAAASATTCAADTTPPAVPAGLTVTVISANRVDVSWSASTDNAGGSGLAGYTLLRLTSLASQTVTLSSLTTAYSDTGLFPLTLVSYQVRASDQAGNLSPYSALVSALTHAGPAWVGWGSTLNVGLTSEATKPALTFSGATPFIVWREKNAGSNRYEIYLRSWTGSAWTMVGGTLTNGPGGTVADAPRLVLIGSTPHVAWQEDTAALTQTLVSVKRWTGTTWQGLGGSLTAGTDWGFVPAVASDGGNPWVAWVESPGTNQVWVKRWDGAAWVQVGDPLNVNLTRDADTTTSPGFAFASGTPYVAWAESTACGGSFNNRVFLKSWTGAAWAGLSSFYLNVDPCKATESPQVAFSGPTPYVAWAEITGTAGQIILKSWSGGVWAAPGPLPVNLDSTRDARRPSVAIDPNGIPYVAWDEKNALSSVVVHVRRLAGGAWEAVGHGTLGVYTDPSRHRQAPSLSFLGSVPYVAWQEQNTGGIWQVYLASFPP